MHLLKVLLRPDLHGRRAGQSTKRRHLSQRAVHLLGRRIGREAQLTALTLVQ